jgi:hypothetical protein
VTALALLMAAQVSVERAFPPDARYEYDLVRTFENAADGETTVLTDRLTYIVVEPGNPAKVTLRRTGVSYALDGHSVPITDPNPIDRPMSMDRLGRVFERGLEPTLPLEWLRLERASELVFAEAEVKPGDSWRRTIPEDPTNRLPAAETMTTVTEVDRSTVSFEVAFAEDRPDGVRANGKVTVSAKDGWPVRSEFVLEGAFLPGDEERLPMTVRVVMTRR